MPRGPRHRHTGGKIEIDIGYVNESGETLMPQQNLDMDLDIPQMIIEVEETVRQSMQRHRRAADIRVRRHPNQDKQGVEVRATVAGQAKPLRLTVCEADWKWDRRKAEAEINGFVRDSLPPIKTS